MADMKLPGALPVPVSRPMPGRRAEAIRTAQAAFFKAAVNEVQAPRPQTPQPKLKAETSEPEAEATEDGRPRRYLRPGSRVDIKV